MRSLIPQKIRNELEALHADTKGIGIMDMLVVSILGVAVALPIVISVVNNTTATGTALTLINLLPTLLALAIVLVYLRGGGMS